MTYIKGLCLTRTGFTDALHTDLAEALDDGGQRYTAGVAALGQKPSVALGWRLELGLRSEPGLDSERSSEYKRSCLLNAWLSTHWRLHCHCERLFDRLLPS
jgi:hypothetical protein